MTNVRFPPEEFEKLKKLLVLYECALKILNVKIEVLNIEYSSSHPQGNPIDHFKSRLKSFESIAEKLYRKGHEITAENAKKHLNDIAGVRIICLYSKDIYKVAESIKVQDDITVVKYSDYVTNPKPSGYRSYHMVLGVPVHYLGKCEKVCAEVQIRTAAMDFWAMLEHKAKYKYQGNIPKHLSDELKICADKTHEIDKRMFLVHDILGLINEH